MGLRGLRNNYAAHKLSISDYCILSILFLAPTFGSLVTAISCLTGIMFIFIFLFYRNFNWTGPLSYIFQIYTLYIIYYLVNGFLNSGIGPTLVSMAPNLPILLFGLMSLSPHWNANKITTYLVGKYSTIGVYITVFLAVILYIFPSEYEIFDHTISEYSGVYMRLCMGAGNPLPFAAILVSLSFLGLVGYSKKTRTEISLAWVGILLTGLIIIYWSQSRGSQLSFFILLIVSLFYLRNSLFSTLSKLRNLLAVFIFITIAFYAVYSFFGNYSINRSLQGASQVFSIILSQDRNIDNSVILRKEIYTASFYTFFEKPLFGFGHANTYQEVKSNSEYLSDFNFSHLHNSYITHLISGGLMGLLVFLLLLASPIILILKTKSYDQEHFLFALIVFTNGIVSGLSNLYLNHDLLSSFNGIMPFLLALTLVNSKTKLVRD